ncbi:MAG: ABC transporter permease [Clostridia bacterium]|nr:ABC transporter permease [Clostridia bacterium]
MKQYILNFLKYKNLLGALVQRDLKTKYRRSFLGIAWSVLNPLLMMLVITAVFQNMFKSNIEHFPIYYLTGFLIFSFVTEATNTSMGSIVDASALIRKVYIPKYLFPLEKCIFSFVNMLFAFVATILVMLILKVPFKITFLAFPIPMLYAFVFAVGLSFFLSAANVFFRDIGHLYGVFTTAWLYLTPIFYPTEILPSAIFKIIKFNPLYHYILYFRALVLQGHIPDLHSNLVCAGFSLVMLVFGLYFFKRKQDKFILYI